MSACFRCSNSHILSCNGEQAHATNKQSFEFSIGPHKAYSHSELVKLMSENWDQSYNVKTKREKFSKRVSWWMLLTVFVDHFYFGPRHIKRDVQLSVWHSQLFSLLPEHTHLQLHASKKRFHLVKFFRALLSNKRVIFWEVFGLFGVCLWACAQCFVHGSIRMSLSYLPFTDKVSAEDRSPLSLCASVV